MCAVQAPRPIRWSGLLEPEADAFRPELRRRHELSNGVKQRLDMFIVAGDLAFQFCEVVSKCLVRCQHSPKPNEGPRTTYTLISTARGLFNTMAVMMAPCSVKVITFCDHLCLLRYGQAKHEIFGEAFPVPFHHLAPDSELPVNSSVINGIII